MQAFHLVKSPENIIVFGFLFIQSTTTSKKSHINHEEGTPLKARQETG